MRTWLRYAAVGCCALTALGVAPAIASADEPLQVAPVQNDPPSLGMISMAPGDSRVVIIGRGLGELLKQVEGSALADAVKRLGLLSSTRDSVQQLGQQLGWTVDEVVERLFGGIVMLTMFDDGPGKSWRWMLVSTISEASAAHLGSKLQAAPADAVGGVPALSIERGRFAMIVRDRPGALGPPGRSGRTRVIGLTPRQQADGGAVAELARTLGGNPADTLGRRGVAGAIRSLGSGHVTLLIGEGGDAEKRWESFSAITARAGRNGWVGEVAMASPAFAAIDTSDPLAGAIPKGDGAIAALAERRLDSASVPWCLRLLESIDAARETGSGSRSLVIRGDDATGFALQFAGKAEAGAATTDVNMNELISRLEGSSQAVLPAAGIAPEAARSTTLTLAPSTVARAALGADHNLTWRCRPDAGQNVLEAALWRAGAAAPQWPTAAGDAPPTLWLASGWARPAALVRLLPPDLVTRLNVLGLADVAASCERLEWTFRLDAEAKPAVIRGRIEARPAAKP